MNTTELVGVVARREILARLRDKTFIASTIFLFVLVAASATVPLLFTHSGPPTITVATVGDDAANAAASAKALGAAAVKAEASDTTASSGALPAATLDIRTAADVAAAERLVRAGTVDAALVPAPGTVGIALVADREVPSELRALVGAATTTDVVVRGLTASDVSPAQVRSALASAAAAAPPERLLNPPAKDAELAIAASIAFALLFFLTTFLFGMAIAQSVVEEKQSRIVEILLAAIPVRVLLAGKVLGLTALALGQITLLVAVGLAGASAAGQSALVGLLLRSSPWFVVFFLLGFSMLACLWAAAGAVASRQEDLQATTMPLQVLLFLPFFAATYVYTPGPLLTTLSYVPFTTPIAMPRRLALGDAAWWEAPVAAVLLALTAVAFVAVATRIYERSVLHAGTRVAWGAALGLRGRRAAAPVPEGA